MRRSTIAVIPGRPAVPARWRRVLAVRAFAAVALVIGLVGVAGVAPRAGAAPAGQVIAVSPGDTDAQILDKAASVVPSARQQAWQQMELTAFDHFGPNTFTGREVGSGTEDPDVFDPSSLDTDQWMRSLRDAGFKQAILTVKHHDGFLLYPTRYSRHSVAASSWAGGHGDVVRSFVNSAHRYGIKVGFYLSPADLHEAQPGGRFGNGSPPVPASIPEAGLDGTRPAGPSFAVTADDYNRFYMDTLYELMSEYGPVDEVWWDGNPVAGGGESYNYPDWIRIVRTLQPHAVIFQDGGPDVRWVGNESGVARTSEYSVLPFTGSASGAGDRITKPDDNGAADLGSDTVLTRRGGDGRSSWNFLKWLPAECDVSLHGGWFWHPDDGPRSLADLESIYYSSVGRNCTLLLNVPPDDTGRFSAADVERLAEFTRWRSQTFGMDLAQGASASNGSGTSNTAGSPPSMAVDGDTTTAWQPTRTTGSLVVDLPTTETVHAIGLQENTAVGQRVTTFTVDAWNGTSWAAVAAGTTVGHKRLLRLTNPVITQRLRLRIGSARGLPAIATFAAYGDGAPPANLALGRPATQSTTHDLGADASRAVDGNTDGNFWDNSVTHTSDTRPDPAPWWQVDLGDSAPIGTINIYNRTDCCAERLSDYWVFTSDTPFDTTKTPDEQAATPGVWSTHETTQAGGPSQLTVGATGRYVMIQQNGPTVLSLAEVEVMRS
jgi:alpha-L-fucosidase